MTASERVREGSNDKKKKGEIKSVKGHKELQREKCPNGRRRVRARRLDLR